MEKSILKHVTVKSIHMQLGSHAQVKRWVKRNGDPLKPNRPYYSGFLNFYEKHLPEISAQYSLNEKDSKSYYRSQVRVRP